MSFDAEIYTSKMFGEVKIFKPSVGHDLRGTIFTTYDDKVYDKYLPENIRFIHDKFAESKYNVLRGLHGDNKTWKLVSCVYGEIYEVVVDVRKNSPTYMKWDAFELCSDKYRQVLIPPGFVNGYYVKSEKAVFHYKLAYTGQYIDADEQTTILWNDKNIAIKWPCHDPILQERDK